MALVHLDPLPRNATPGEVLRFVCDTARLDSKHVGKIQLVGNAATVELPDGKAAAAVEALDGATFRDYCTRARLGSALPTDHPTAGHFDKLARLLTLEAAEEKRRLALEAKETRDADPGDDRAGTSLRPLLLAEEDYGLGGRLLLSFVRSDRGPLPPNRLGPGAPVLLTQLSHRPLSVRGVVLERGERAITVAFEEPDDDLPDAATWRLDLSPDEASRRRQLGALHRVQAATEDRLAELRDVLLGEKKAGESRSVATVRLSSTTLNDSQQAAVAFALDAPDVACIHGPPGTGKTTTVVELIRLAVARGEKVLATAPSNAAVDNLLEKLLAVGLEPVRLGHPARVAESLRDRTLDLLVEKHPIARQAKKFTREAFKLFRTADKWTRGKPDPGEKAAARTEARQLLADARKAEQLATDKVLDEARVICGTLTGMDGNTLGRRWFELAVIDEACQATEPASWLPLVRAKRVVFAGDPCQLPPTVLSGEAVRGGLNKSLMERAMRTLSTTASRLLTVQYRMHADIMGFSNAEFYHGELVADPSVISHRLVDLPGVTADLLTESAVRFIDTAGAGYDEQEDEDTDSRFNPQEAALVAKKARLLIALGVLAADIAVITPYSAQVRHLRELLAGTGVEVDSVDGFQGREKEAVLISFVRSNPEGQIGFLSDTRRTNVAMTRARRLLLMVGDSATLAGHEMYQRLIAHVEKTGAYASVWEEVE